MSKKTKIFWRSCCYFSRRLLLIKAFCCKSFLTCFAKINSAESHIFYQNSFSISPYFSLSLSIYIYQYSSCRTYCAIQSNPWIQYSMLLSLTTFSVCAFVSLSFLYFSPPSLLLSRIHHIWLSCVSQSLECNSFQAKTGLTG